MKIAILGYSGSGKSTLAKKLAKFYDVTLLFLDTIQFEANWTERNKGEARSIVWEFMQNESWVIDGNYTGFYQRERLEQADEIIILEFPRSICLPRAYKRYKDNKNKTREGMAKGCIEKMDSEFVWWILHEGRTKQKRNHYKDIANKFKDKVVVLKNPKDVKLYLENKNKLSKY